MEKPFSPADPNFETRCRSRFANQNMMNSVGMTAGEISAGKFQILMPFSKAFMQQNGFIHAGIIATGLDACSGFAVYTLLPEDKNVLTIEFKVNFLRPAIGQEFIFEAEVIKVGSAISVCEGVAFAVKDGERKKIATMTATLMSS